MKDPFKLIKNTDCPIELTCSMAEGEQDLCSISEELTEANFYSTAGQYEFRSYDIDSYAPGSYYMKFTGSLKTESDELSKSVIVKIVLEDPCPTTTLSLNQEYFKDASYTLRDAGKTYTWLDSDLYSMDTLIDCGDITVDFFIDDEEKTPLNPWLFRQTNDPSAFIILQTQDVDLKGVYEIRYEIVFIKYPEVSAELASPFVVTVVDPCDNPESLVTSSDLLDQKYIITQDVVSYQASAFTPTPAWCAITYSYTISEVEAEAAIKFGPANGIFHFSYESDLSLSGETSKDYEITVKGQVGTETKKEAESFFVLTILNPCKDPRYVHVSAPKLED